jgi:hypothetical protein
MSCTYLNLVVFDLYLLLAIRVFSYSCVFVNLSMCLHRICKMYADLFVFGCVSLFVPILACISIYLIRFCWSLLVFAYVFLYLLMFDLHLFL